MALAVRTPKVLVGRLELRSSFHGHSCQSGRDGACFNSQGSCSSVVRKFKHGFGAMAREVIARTVPPSVTTADIQD